MPMQVAFAPAEWFVFYEPAGDARPHVWTVADEQMARMLARCIEQSGGRVLAVRSVADTIARAGSPDGGYVKAVKVHANEMAERLESILEILGRLEGSPIDGG